jgi:hypothetical protein
MQQGVGVHGGEVDLGDAGRVGLLGPGDHEIPSHGGGTMHHSLGIVMEQAGASGS